ncbi:MAG: S8 family peptidase, partial [Thiobacillus sp.]
MNTVFGAVRAFSSTVVLVLAAVFSSAALAAHIDPDALVKLSDKAARGEPVKLIVRLKGDSSAKAADTNSRAVLRSLISAKQQGLLKRHGGWFKTVKHYRETPYVALETNQKGLAALLADGDVTSIEEDIPVEMTLNDTPVIVNADQAWSSGYRGAGQAVAILDTGVDTAHPFFAGKIVAEACFSQNGTSTTSRCPNGQNSQIGPGSGMSCSDSGCWHGTHVAGIAAGKSGILAGAGMGPDAKIIPIQVFTRYCDAAGACSLQAYTSDIGLALDHVYQLSTTITIASVNLSLGGGSYTSACDSVAPSIKELIDTLRNVNIATIISSGNDSAPNAISFPACISSAVSVGSTTKQNTVASYSNSSAQLALLAPGSSIYSSVSGGGYGTASGTSMAAPHVTGVWALMKSAKPSATVTEVLTALQSTGLPITDSRNGLSKPLIQVGGPAGAIAKMVGAANQPPTVALTSPANNASFTAPATIALTATASDADGTIAKVEFYQGASLIGTDTNGADGW